MTRVMLDIETLSTAPNAVVCTVGARNWATGQEFYRRAAWQDRHDQPGRIVDPSTVAWWLGQSAEAQAELTGEGDREHLAKVLDDLAGWLRTFGTPEEVEIWTRGSLDVLVLEHAYRDLRTYGTVPWKYSNVRDVRTLLAIAGVESHKTATHHALEDCRKQVRECQEALGRLDDRAFNAIAEACGVSDWDYPGQLVRDVRKMGEMLRELADAIDAEPNAFGSLRTLTEMRSGPWRQVFTGEPRATLPLPRTAEEAAAQAQLGPTGGQVQSQHGPCDSDGPTVLSRLPDVLLDPAQAAFVAERLESGEAKYGAKLRVGWTRAGEALEEELADALAYAVALGALSLASDIGWLWARLLKRGSEAESKPLPDLAALWVGRKADGEISTSQVAGVGVGLSLEAGLTTPIPRTDTPVPNLTHSHTRALAYRAADRVLLQVTPADGEAYTVAGVVIGVERRELYVRPATMTEAGAPLRISRRTGLALYDQVPPVRLLGKAFRALGGEE